MKSMKASLFLTAIKAERGYVERFRKPSPQLSPLPGSRRYKLYKAQTQTRCPSTWTVMPSSSLYQAKATDPIQIINNNQNLDL